MLKSDQMQHISYYIIYLYCFVVGHPTFCLDTFKTSKPLFSPVEVPMGPQFCWGVCLYACICLWFVDCFMNCFKTGYKHNQLSERMLYFCDQQAPLPILQKFQWDHNSECVSATMWACMSVVCRLFYDLFYDRVQKQQTFRKDTSLLWPASHLQSCRSSNGITIPSVCL